MGWDVWAPVAASSVTGALAVWGVNLAAKRESTKDSAQRDHERTEARRAERKDTYRTFLHAAGAFAVACRQVISNFPPPGGEPLPELQLPGLYQALAIAASEVFIVTTNAYTRQAVETFMDASGDLFGELRASGDRAEEMGDAMGDAMKAMREAMARELDIS